MQFWDYNENRQRGTKEFPVDFHHVDVNHPRYNMPYHWHMEYEIIRILEGTFHITIDDTTHEAKAGDILLVKDGLLHGGIAVDCVYECIVFDLNVLIKQNPTCRQYIQFLTTSPISIKPHITSDHTQVHRIVWSMFDEFLHERKGHELFFLGFLYQFLGQIYSENLYCKENSYLSKDKRRIQQFKKVFDYIEQNYSQVITVEELSTVADMSPRYFYRIFYSLTHRSPIDYLNHFRIERACNYLVSTDMPITEIAYNCGFNDLSYFIKTFKRYKGVPPKKYQQAEGITTVLHNEDDGDASL